VHYKVAILAADGLFESEKAGIASSPDKSGDGSMGDPPPPSSLPPHTLSPERVKDNMKGATVGSPFAEETGLSTHAAISY
jgi:hypothetical protein